MKKDAIRQAKRGTLKVCPSFNNNQVFHLFGCEQRQNLKKPEALLRLKAGKANGPIEEVALLFFKALKKGHLLIGRRPLRIRKSPEDRLLFLFQPESHILGYKIRGETFRRTIQSERDALWVLERFNKSHSKTSPACDRTTLACA